MQDIKQWQEKIQNKRKQTPWRNYLMEITSWLSFTFYKNNNTISRYPSTNRIKIEDYNSFMKKREDLQKTWCDYDLQLSFFDNVIKFFKNFHHPNLIFYWTVENADFSDQSYNVENVYLSNTTIIDCSNVLYSFSVSTSSNVINSFYVKWSEVVHFSKWIQKSYKIFYSAYIYDSNNIYFSDNLIGCNECISCSHLENQKYCINNKQLPKDEYFKKKKDILSNKKKFFYYYQWLDHKWQSYWNNGASWNYILNSEHVENWLYVMYGKNQRNVWLTWWNTQNENIFDTFSAGAAWGNDFYAVIAAGKSQNLYCSTLIVWSSNIYYSYYLENCSYCLGCIWLKNKSFCILNKQYTKEERFEKANEIFAQMEKDGDLGKFFPWSMNPFYFNDTVAYLIDDSFTKEEVEKEWYLRRDEAIKVDIPEWMDMVKTTELNNYQWRKINDKFYTLEQIWDKKLKEWIEMQRYIDPEILKKVIVDEKGNYYRIVKMEYDFLMKHALPLPEIHWLERIKLGFKFE